MDTKRQVHHIEPRHAGGLISTANIAGQACNGGNERAVAMGLERGQSRGQTRVAVPKLLQFGRADAEMRGAGLHRELRGHLGEIGRDAGLCASAILKSDPHILLDAKTDPNALANPLVAGDFGLRF